MKRPQLLILLLVILVAAAIYAFLASPRQERVAPEAALSGGSDRPAEGGGKVKESLQLELLDRTDAEFEVVTRNIFEFYTPPPPPPPPPPVVRKPLPAPPPPVIKAPPPRPVVRPMARFTFLGLLTVEEEVTVFLSAGENLYLVKDGDTFGEKNQFQVEEILPEEILISQEGQSGTIRVALKEKEQPDGHGLAQPAGPGGAAPAMRRPVPPLNRPQIPSFKRYKP